MGSIPTVSIIVPVYNQGQYVAECLDSILSQTFKDYEVIIINDGSTDDSEKNIENYVRSYPNFRYFSQSNKGVVYTRNKAVELAQGEFIFPLDADDKIAPDCLEKLYAAICAKKGDILTSRVWMFGEKNGELCLCPPKKSCLVKENCLVNAALFRKSDFIKAGGYDENFSFGLEDYDLWLNMVLRCNLKIYRVPEMLFFYRIKKMAESRNKQQSKCYSALLKSKLFSKYPELRFYRFFIKLKNFFYYRGVKKGRFVLRILGFNFYYSN